MRNYRRLFHITLLAWLLVAIGEYYLVFGSFMVIDWTFTLMIGGLTVGLVILAFPVAIFYDRWLQEQESYDSFAVTEEMRKEKGEQ